MHRQSVWGALSHRLGLTAIRQQRVGALIKADARARGIIRFFVQIEQVFHPRDELDVRLGMHHCSFNHGLSSFFLSTRRTIAQEMSSTRPNSTT